MSKKSNPGDGQHGKGVKGMKKPFEELFEDKAHKRQSEEQPSKTDATEAEQE